MRAPPGEGGVAEQDIRRTDNAAYTASARDLQPVSQAVLPIVREIWWRLRRREGVESGDPLFCSQTRKRISPRRVQFAFRTWQVKAGFDRLYPFHALRHTAVTNVYRKSRDLFLAQRFARHVSPLTTTVYTHPSDQELWESIRRLSC